MHKRQVSFGYKTLDKNLNQKALGHTFLKYITSYGRGTLREGPEETPRDWRFDRFSKVIFDSARFYSVQHGYIQKVKVITEIGRC